MSSDKNYDDAAEGSREEEIFPFQAEITQLLDMIINSFYTERDIFVRELITNSCDAIDKYRLKKNLDMNNTDNTEYFIKIKIYNDRIQFVDNGIGMSRNDLIKNLGTIAKSGTRDFFKKFNDGTSNSNNASGIGNFGVGFYSVFLVAKSSVCRI
jgi:HSP90 family molecular chaperone